jgi:hypothetical protein
MPPSALAVSLLLSTRAAIARSGGTDVGLPLPRLADR